MVGLTISIHFGLIISTLLPHNAVSSAVAPAARRWVDPVFSQDWRLFAPKPENSDVRILARGVDRTGHQHTQWLDVNTSLVIAIRRNPLSPLALPEILSAKCALVLLSTLINGHRTEQQRQELIKQWGDPGRKPPELIALERAGSSLLRTRRVTHYPRMQIALHVIGLGNATKGRPQPAFLVVFEPALLANVTAL